LRIPVFRRLRRTALSLFFSIVSIPTAGLNPGQSHDPLICRL
jgi:hypothetical protein